MTFRKNNQDEQKMKGLGLKKVVSELKKEIIEIHKAAQEGKDAKFDVLEAEVELGVEINKSVKGKANFLVVQIGGGASKTTTHKVRLKLRPKIEVKKTKEEIEKLDYRDATAFARLVELHSIWIGAEARAALAASSSTKALGKRRIPGMGTASTHSYLSPTLEKLLTNLKIQVKNEVN